MKPLFVVLVFVGVVMIVTGMYDQKVADALNRRVVEYRFIPRSTYEEQMDSTAVSTTQNNMFSDAPLMSSGRQAVLPNQR